MKLLIVIWFVFVLIENTVSNDNYDYSYDDNSDDNEYDNELEKVPGIVDMKVLSTQIYNLVVNKNSGHVYIGGINIIYQLSSKLEILNVAVTGPKMDSLDCTISDCPTNTMKQLTPNINKVLLIDYDSNSLITCGTLFQGICDVRNLQNISIIEQEINEAVVSNTNTDSTFAFIGPGPNLKNVMYVGVTFNDNSPYRSEIPAVSSRSLEKNNWLDIVSENTTSGTRIFLNSCSRNDYKVNYIYGFSSEGFSYFMTTQLKNHKPSFPKEYITKLIRISQGDSHYNSYTEVELICEANTTHYNLVQVASLGKSSQNIAKHFGITEQDDVLYAIFSNKYTSALCIYSLKEINRKFLENIEHCFIGQGTTGLDFIKSEQICVQTKLHISEDFCGLDYNWPIEVKLPIISHPVLELGYKITSFITKQTDNYTIAYIGSHDGYSIEKYSIDIENNYTDYVGEISVSYNSQIISDMHFDKEKEHLYVMTKNKIYKVGLLDCEKYVTVDKCLGAKIPYCGWCLYDNKCMTFNDCSAKINETMHWVPFSEYTTLKEIQINKLDLSRKKFLEPKRLTSKFMITFKKTVKTNKFYLSLKHSNLTKVVSNWTINLNFNELHWKIIDFSFNSIYHLDDGIFDDLVDIDTLNLNENLLESLPLGLFDKTTKLLNINLSSNKLKDLNEGVFDKLTKLKYLDLSNNNLVSLPYKMLNENHDLLEFDLSQNLIKYLKNNIFTSINLLKLNISNNPFISYIDPDLFIGLQSLKSLDISNCNGITLHSDKNKNEIQHIKNSANEKFHEDNFEINLPENLKLFLNFDNLIFLDISKNELTKIPFLDNAYRLKTLNLNHNKINDIQLNEIKHLISLQDLNISFNKLTFLRAEVLEHLKDLNQLETKGNPFQCPCYDKLMHWRRLNKITENLDPFYKFGKSPVCFVSDTSKCWYNVEINEYLSNLYFKSV